MLCFCITKNENAPFPRPFGATGNDAQNFMRSGICLYSWCTVPRMKFVFCLSARGVQFGFLLKLFAWKGKVSGMSTKFVFVTGGVVSGLGKGICAASLGRLLKQRGVRVRNQKFDPYINVDPGTMSPYQHGEVFVTEDGAETDLDLGHYERFTDEDLTVDSSITSGKVYWSVLSREREGAFLGGTVQVIPHITGEIKERIYRVGRREEVDVVITEIGGTVGDIESQPFLEAIRQVSAEVGRQNVLYLHVSLIVSIPGTGEPKSKPTQHSVKELLGLGENLRLHSVVAFGYPTHKSHLVAMQNGNVKYYLDDARDYCVPKRPMEEILLKTL